ncbi:MAG: GerMN domain-containing protein [Clostridium sp.]|nr:GerMN domain-containing protein [Clostridium sp.]
MGFWSKLVILVLAGLAFFYVKVNFFDSQPAKVEKKLVVEEQVVEPKKQEEHKKAEEKKIPKTFVTVYFLGMDKNDTGIFKKVQRELPAGQSKLKFALNQLCEGPSPYEKKIGVYSEIPKNVKILGIVESKNKIIIDVSSNIQNGGGADSIYSRMKQFIKTALVNAPKKPIYLYIDGKQAEVLGGEGIMISQPLNENSLDG